MSDSGIQADKEKLQLILQREEYAAYTQQSGNPVMEWLEQVFHKLLNLFPDVSVPDETSRVLVYALLALFLLAIGAAIVWLVRSLIIHRRRRRTAAFLSGEELDYSFAAYWREAEAMAEQGRYAEAVRFAFMAIVLYMDERGWMKAEKWKTNREYVEELAERQTAAVPGFTAAAAVFEQVWYGGAAADSQKYEQIAAQLAPYLKGGQGDGQTK